MRTNHFNAILKTAVRGSSLALVAAVVAFGQQQVNLTAGPATAVMPDGTAVPMWGYTCGAAVTGSTAACAALDKTPATGTTWSPVVITVPAGQGLTINLTNHLSFGTAPNNLPTSLVIVGQMGGGLGTPTSSTVKPDHTNAQPLTWPIAGVPATAGVGTPPAQGFRVQSFGTEVAATPAASTASTALTWPALRPGTYLLESGTHPSIQGPMGLYGMVVVTCAPGATTAVCANPGTAYPAVGTTVAAVTYNAEVPLVLSEIDPVQNTAVQTAVGTTGFLETNVWSGQPGQCGNPSAPVGVVNTCYPPAVNYTPLYYLINGVAFNKTNAGASVFATVPATGVTGSVLVRLVNAGLRMHVPSIVGSQTGTAVAPATAPPAGFSLIAEDGNRLPGVPRVQSEVFMAAGKTYDVMINAVNSPASTTALPIFDRELSLSDNSSTRDGGMLAYIGVNGSAPPAAAALATASARNDNYTTVIPCSAAPCKPVVISDPTIGVIGNDINVYGVTVLTPPATGTLTLNRDGTFTYVPAAGFTSSSVATFTYCANGTVTGTTCSSGITATATLSAAAVEAATGITMNNDTYTATASSLSIKPSGILANDKDAAGYPLTVALPLVSQAGCTTLSVDPNGGFNASAGAGGGTCTFVYKARNSQGTVSTATATVTITFPAASNLSVTVKDPTTNATISDYRWVIEEDRTFYVNPKCTANPPPAGCPSSAAGIVPTFGTNFHTSYMPVVATGCTGSLSCESGQTVFNPATGTHQNAVCDIGNGVCRTTATQQAMLLPSQVHLDPTKRYYMSILPGDAGNPFIQGNVTNVPSGHGMGGAPIACVPTAPAVTCTAAGTFPPVTIITQPTPFPPAKLSVFVYEDDFPLNGEQDGGGGVDVLSPNEPGLGGFNITLFDDAGGTGDATGQMTYDMFNMPLSNSLDGFVDPATGQNACPITAQGQGITGTIVVCPKFEADGKTLSPLAGQAVVANLMPGRYGVVATPAADRIARGEEWLQTNTLDGQKAHDSFLRIGEPSFFQEFGPAGYHVSIGFANPDIINSRRAAVCNGTDPNITGTGCTNTITGVVTTERMSRTPDERLYSSGDNSSFGFTQCYVSFGDPDGEDFAFTKCDGDGHFSLSGLPNGDWRITVFDQWNDMLVDGLSTPVRLAGGSTNLGQIAMNQWQANIYTKTFFDMNGNGIQDPNEQGLTLVATNIRFRDGSYSNFNNTDLSGNAGFNEVFPLFSWYVIESDSTRYKTMGTHVVYDAGGPADGTPCGAATTPPTAPCGNSTIAGNLANTAEQLPLPTSPTNLRIPGARYCASADCPAGDTAGGSTGRVDPPMVHPYGSTYGWQGFSGQNSFLEFGKKPYAVGENGGIRGEVTYASTRPFDDPGLLIHTSWTPNVPGVTINLYQEGTGADGSQTLKLVDTTKTSSWDDWAQGFRSNGVPNMNCPGQGTASGTAADLFFFTLYNQPMYLDVYNNGGTPAHTIPYNSQFKCYDGMHNWNQLQPAPYDGMYQFPSVVALDTTTGKPTGTGSVNGTRGSVIGSNCTICVPNPDTTDPFRAGTAMLPAGKYVVEVVVPPGYELVKEEDKNILIGDNYIAPVTQEFGGLGSIFILPDQAQIASGYNANNFQNPTNTLGRTSLPSHEGDTGSVETFWPCVGQARVVPDYISLFPQSKEVAPFAGATRNLCDRKEVTLEDQTNALAKFWVFTSAHVAAHFTGVITDDFTSEFDPFSPQFGEKFSPANLPVALKDWSGTEISRVYADQWGTYDGLTYSTWEVNPPNPTGYAPTMMVTCMNDPGTGATPDPLFNPSYSQFCYEIPFMPGQTQYMDTPVTPTSAFAGAGYNNPDCAYPDATPAISEVDGDGVGPYVSAAGNTLTITALGDQQVTNYGYSGPSTTTVPYNQKTVTRHYGFGAAQGTGTVTIGGINATVTGWSDTQITVTVPTGVANCAVQQQTQYGGSTAKCGQLVITAGNGKQSIDTVTVTIGGKAPAHVAASGSIQAAIDAAKPGDLIMIDPTCTTTTGAVACTTAGVTKSAVTHQELLLMWKPVRLQGVGAVSSVINANTHPAGKLDVWRRQVNCLFGLALNGGPISATNPYDQPGGFTCSSSMQAKVDRLPLEAALGWDATQNGNLAELLQEPSLMGALEGAAITVLAKGVDFHGANQWDSTLSGAFPTGTTLLTASNCGTTAGPNPNPSNFQCNPSSIDGLTITNSSQGGGGIFVHGWGHNLQIANNRVVNNSGTLSGGINVGQGEFPPSYLGGAAATNAPPGSCQTSNVANLQLPYCHNLNVNVHNNDIALNSSTGDELFSATPAGAGGVSFCTGADFYKFNFNWLCGNLSTGDGGGLGHIGFSYNGDIEHNTIIFNQSTNPTIAANGGGIVVMGAPDVDPTCGATTDQDCVPNPGTVGPSDGTGPSLTINANLIMGNAAESGSGGGLRLQNVNGSEVVSFPTTPTRWNTVNITNNIITNNVAGWDGAGISLQDALVANIINNTIVSNDTTASSGVLFNTLGAPLASSGGPTCTTNCGTSSLPQPSGLVSIQNSAVLVANLPATITCPAGHFTTTASNGTCRSVSYPLLYNDVFYQNRDFHIAVGSLGTGTQNQQNVVALIPTLNQATTGQCVTTTNYWDIGVRGDTGPTNHASGVTLRPTYSDIAGYTGSNNIASNPNVVSQYCNGSRVPPELGTMGYNVPPGISDATVPNPIFNLTPAATVDEGNNWINISWGPLSLTNPSTGVTLGNYAPNTGSPLINAGTSAAVNGVAPPTTDFFGHTRTAPYDIGAVEVVAGGGGGGGNFSVAPTSAAFGGVVLNSNSAGQTLTLSNATAAAVTLTSITVAQTSPTGASTFSRPAGAAGGTCSTATPVTAGGSCTIIVVFRPTAAVAYTGTVTIAASVAVVGSPVSLTGTGVTAPARPALTVLDNFNRANANTLGASWTQGTLLGLAAITINANQALDPLVAGTAFWTAAFGAKEAAAFTIAGTTLNNDALLLAATGTLNAANVYQSFIRVLYNGGTVTVATTTNNGGAYSTAGTLTSAFANGDTIAALLDGTSAVAAPTVYVWRTTAANVTTFLGAVQITPNALWTGGGRIGMQMPANFTNARVDNYAGGTTP